MNDYEGNFLVFKYKNIPITKYDSTQREAATRAACPILYSIQEASARRLVASPSMKQNNAVFARRVPHQKPLIILLLTITSASPASMEMS